MQSPVRTPLPGEAQCGLEKGTRRTSHSGAACSTAWAFLYPDSTVAMT
jgi:hypothetical protein